MQFLHRIDDVSNMCHLGVLPDLGQGTRLKSGFLPVKIQNNNSTDLKRFGEGSIEIIPVTQLA